MPAVSKKQRRAAAIAEHAPGKLYARNKPMMKMGKGDLHKFASSSEKGLPMRVRQVDNRIKRKKIK